MAYYTIILRHPERPLAELAIPLPVPWDPEQEIRRAVALGYAWTCAEPELGPQSFEVRGLDLGPYVRQCRDCAAAVVWLCTPTGKALAVDASPDALYQAERGNGLARRCRAHYPACPRTYERIQRCPPDPRAQIAAETAQTRPRPDWQAFKMGGQG